MLLMLPSTDCRIDDTWFVVGLRGSGSKDVVVDGAFVPHHRAVSMNDVREGCTPAEQSTALPTTAFPCGAFCPSLYRRQCWEWLRVGWMCFRRLSRGGCRGAR